MTFLAWWGAGLSTLLAVVKLWELWSDRFRVDVGYNFTGSSEVGNEVIVRNLTGTPIILSHWELLWVSGRWPFRTESNLTSPQGDSGDIHIAAHSSLTLTFQGQEHFDWGERARKGRRIYVRLWIAGRRPILRKVYG